MRDPLVLFAAVLLVAGGLSAIRWLISTFDDKAHPQAALGLLLAMEAERDFLPETEEAETYWGDTLHDAVAGGWVAPPTGWNYGYSLTAKAKRTIKRLREAGQVRPLHD